MTGWDETKGFDPGVDETVGWAALFPVLVWTGAFLTKGLFVGFCLVSMGNVAYR